MMFIHQTKTRQETGEEEGFGINYYRHNKMDGG